MEKQIELFSKEWVLQITKEIKNTKANWSYMIEASEHMAKLQRLKYDSLIKQGFDDKQALYLTKEGSG